MTVHPGSEPFAGELVVTREVSGHDDMIKQHAVYLLHDLIRQQGGTPIPDAPVELVKRTPLRWRRPTEPASDPDDGYVECDSELAADAFRLLWRTRALPPATEDPDAALRAKLAGMDPAATVLLQHGDRGPVTSTTAGALLEDLELVEGSPVPGMLRDAFDAAMRGHGPVTLYDTPADPLAAVTEMAARIRDARAASTILVTGEPLGFEVSALAGWEVRRAGADVALADGDGVMGHAYAVPPAGWVAGWVVARATCEGVGFVEPPGLTPWGVPPSGPDLLTGLPLWFSDDAPAGMLIPVLVRPGEPR